MYHVANVSVHDSQADCEIRFATLPNTWVTHKAWKAAFEAWKTQLSDNLEDLPEGAGSTGKWSDFKVYMNNDHKDDPDKLFPVDCEATSGSGVHVLNPGEWDYTDVQTRVSGTAYSNLNFVMAGAHNIANNGEIGVIKALEDLWPQDSYDPELSPAYDESPILGMTGNLKNEEVLDAIMDENDQPPYDYFNFVGCEDNLPSPLTVREGSITTTQNEMTYLGGFEVPLGLLCIETKSGTDGNIIGVSLELAPGPYKGLMSEAI